MKDLALIRLGRSLDTAKRQLVQLHDEQRRLLEAQRLIADELIDLRERVAARRKGKR